ncbi:complement factor H-like [Solea solea]|uniref:complement factor H-like n=1 Tax=Solea solea TaxID=90069 RepID=UPI00272A25E2|nr:complement factor H-like [Solea solea]
MRMKYFGFILLIWVPGGLHAQSDAEPCSAPKLNGGYFVPEHETYSHGTKLQYACNTGHKPAVEGWWATSTCHRGEWFHKPQCIDENACILPTIVNGKYEVPQEGWFKNGRRIFVTCDKRYELKDKAATAQCKNGTWSSLPICQKTRDTCSEPPKIPHAVVIRQQYQELFAADSQVEYRCEKGYTMEEAQRNPIICMGGNWTNGPNCTSRPVTGQGGSAEVGTPGSDTTSAGGGTQSGGSRPGTGQGGSADVGTRGRDTTSAGGGVGRGSSTTSDVRLTTTTIDNCVSEPVILHGEVVYRDEMQLKYACVSFYTLVGEATVVCYNDGNWSQFPTCKEAFCVMKPRAYTHGLTTHGPEYINEGHGKHIPCIWAYYSVVVHCANGVLSYTNCCSSYDHNRGLCPIIGTTS